MQAAFGRIGRALNGADILWGVGASLMLRQYGLADDPHDIDLIVSACDAENADALLRGMGKAVECRPSVCMRRNSQKVRDRRGVRGPDGGFRIVHENGRYEYPSTLPR
jgi:hypothetical protein